MLEMIFSTDLHGDVRKFEDVFNYAVRNRITLIHLGADILPKGSGILENQKKFVKGFLRDYYNQADKKGITVLAHFGNDDLYTRKKYFTYAPLLDEQEFVYNDGSLHGYRFIAYGYVPDYPFGLKTACKLDHRGWSCPDRYLSAPVDVNEKGFFQIQDIKDYFEAKGTIKEDLKKLHVIKVNHKMVNVPYYASLSTIASIHCPPAGRKLDVCADGRCVGSRAVHDWIIREKPLIVLCGHIHESPDVCGVWKTRIGKTVVIQPGQAPFYHGRTKAVRISFTPLTGVCASLLEL